MYTGEEGNRVGRNFGDEYFAELDMIEVVERFKRIGDEPGEDSDEGIDCKEMSDKDETFNAKRPTSTGYTRKSQRKKVVKKSSMNSKPSTGAEALKDFVSVRTYFGQGEESYIMDAKKIGNIGRYMNHSCNPNVFVQNHSCNPNVFVQNVLT